MSNSHPQPALNLYLPPQQRFENFLPGSNAVAVASVRELLNGDHCRLLYLWGPPDTGKSHLQAAACHWCTEHGLTSVYLPLDRLPGHDGVLENMQDMYLVCLDNLHRMAGKRAFEQQLFNLINEAASIKGARLMVVADRPPASLQWSLGDLKSRLQAGLILQLQPLDEGGKRTALQLHAQSRHIPLPEPVLEYIFRHQNRSMHHLVALLDKLDQMTLAEKKRLTVPYVRRILAS